MLDAFATKASKGYVSQTFVSNSYLRDILSVGSRIDKMIKSVWIPPWSLVPWVPPLPLWDPCDRVIIPVSENKFDNKDRASFTRKLFVIFQT